ncbi:hypothetical protein CR513_18596, partial [Mucuna pruriens]
MMKMFILFSITFACGFIENVVSNANPLPYEAIFNFGDSISDTGNAATYHHALPSNSPYGSTYFKHASGRMSNGRLIIDFIAEAYGLPMLPAYLNLTKGQDIKKGKLIEEGAVKLVVPGNFPIGCNSAVLATVNSDKIDDYDQFGCLKAYNAFIKYYNKQLKKAIRTLRQNNLHVKITYFDYYGAAKRLFQAPQQYGG